MRGREKMFRHFSSDISEPLSLICRVAAVRCPHAAAESSHGPGRPPAQPPSRPLDTPASARELPAAKLLQQ